MSSPVIGFAGMTHLGLNSAVASAERGFEMVCFDSEAGRIAMLDAGNLPVVEPDLPEMFARNRDRLTFTATASDLKRCDVIYVAPDVPTDDTGRSDLAGIHSLIDTVHEAMRDDATLVVLSQVPPGFTRALSRPSSVLYYQVETLIFGRAIERAMYPERFIIGCAEPVAPLPAALQTYLDAFTCPILPMRYESAELAKISINCCLVASVSVANTLAELCENIGADWSEIVPALKLDRRIGQYAYLAPGLGISGGNLERDLATVIRFAQAKDTDAGVVASWVSNSKHRKQWPFRRLSALLLDQKPDATIGVLGLAYKQDTHSTKNSPSLAFLSSLSEQVLVKAHDPVVPVDKAYHPTIQGAETALDVANGADAVLILTPWGEYKDLDVAALAQRMAGRLLLDPLGVLDGKACFEVGLNYHTLGKEGA
jgi:UDPglucose 6-dehydrogenase